MPLAVLLDELKLAPRCSAFQLEQHLLSIKAARIARQAAVASDDSMTWDHNADRITPVCQTNSADRRTVADSIGKLRVGSRLSVWDVAKMLPYSLLKICPFRSEWNREHDTVLLEVLL